MTAFEPEALGNLVEGIDFHKFYFDNHGKKMADCTDYKDELILQKWESRTLSLFVTNWFSMFKIRTNSFQYSFLWVKM